MVTAAAGAAGAALLVACGGSSGDDDGGGDCVMNGTTVQISGNHGHVLTVSKTEVTDGVAKSYGIMGSADHNHMVTISAAAFAMLAGNSSVMTVSTTDSSHSHNITVACA
jgi:hypothetical protein